MIDIGRQCDKNLASVFPAWFGIKAAYRFFANPKVDESRMLAPHIEHTVARSGEHEPILVLQDTAYLDYSQRDRTPDLDFVQRSKLGKVLRGLMVHNTLV